MKLILHPINLRHARVSTHAYDAALDMARHTGAKLILMTVAPEMERNLNIRDSEAFWKQELGSFLKSRPPGDVDVGTLVRKGGTHRQIVRAAEELKADLIVMGARNPTITDYLTGTTATHVVGHATCSVYIVRRNRP